MDSQNKQEQDQDKYLDVDDLLKEEQPNDNNEKDKNEVEEEPKKKSKSCYKVGQYKKKPKLAPNEARKLNLAKARYRREVKRVTNYQFEDTDSSESEKDNEKEMVTQRLKIDDTQNVDDPKYDKLQNELVALKSIMMKQAKKKAKSKAINVNINSQPQQSQEISQAMKEKLLMSFN